MDQKFFHEVSMQWFQTINSAGMEARTNDCRWIEVEHLLFAILSRESWPGNGGEIFMEIWPHFPACEKEPGANPEASPKTEEVIRHASYLGKGVASPLGALIAILEIGGLPKKALEVLENRGVTAETARTEYKKRYQL